MTNYALEALSNEKLRNAVDWTVFTLGAASLTIAIAATLLTPNSNIATIDPEPTPVVLAG